MQFTLLWVPITTKMLFCPGYRKIHLCGFRQLNLYTPTLYFDPNDEMGKLFGSKNWFSLLSMNYGKLMRPDCMDRKSLNYCGL